MMAKQVRPWQVKPISHREQKARQSVEEPASEFHQGQRLVASIKSPDLWLQSLTCIPSLIESLAKRGRPSMCENSTAKEPTRLI